MITASADDFHVHLTVADARTAQATGVTFARRLASANPAAVALALAEQELLVERAITDAGHSVEQAQLATGYFGSAARDAWERVMGGSEHDAQGQA